MGTKIIAIYCDDAVSLEMIAVLQEVNVTSDHDLQDDEGVRRGECGGEDELAK
jgi:hypothetical protein